MRYKLLGRRSGLRVSQLALGAGMFGTRWGYGAGPEETHRMLAAYADAGGNFIDAADSYQSGEAEEIVGDFLQTHRDAFVLASKYSQGVAPDGGVLNTGNSRIAMVRSVEQSLKRLRTDRIDIYMVHMADGVTPIDEIVRGLDDLGRAGKIVYGGLSDFPAWRTATAATLADAQGRAPIVVQQVEYSLVQRTPERELLPMAAALGIGTLGWGPLGGGLLTGKYRRGEEGRRAGFGGRMLRHEDSAQRTAILDVLEAVAVEVGTNPGRVALAWVMERGVIPVIGPRTCTQLEDNLAATTLTLAPEQIARLDEASHVPLGFPHEFLASASVQDRVTGGKRALIDPPILPVR